MEGSAVKNVVPAPLRYADMRPEEFGPEMIEKWNAAEQTLTHLREQVENGVLSPKTAARTFSCLTGDLFSYDEFHGVKDILASIIPAVNSEIGGLGR